MKKKSLRFKIILSTTICVLVVGIISNFYLYFYLTKIISVKSEYIDTLNMETVQNRVDQVLDSLNSLGQICAFDNKVVVGIKNKSLNTAQAKREALTSQEMLNSYLSAFNDIQGYVNKVIIFNQHGVQIQAVSQVHNMIDDYLHVQKLPIFKRLEEENLKQIIGISPSIAGKQDCIAYMGRVYEYPNFTEYGWIYIELDSSLITEIFKVYPSETMYIVSNNGASIPAGLSEELISGVLDGESKFNIDKNIYSILCKPLSCRELWLFSKTDITFLSHDTRSTAYTAIIVILSSLLVALILAFLLGHQISKPIQRIIYRIRCVSENDFSYDPEIEKGSGELAEMGKVLNEMIGSIKILLNEIETMYEREKNMEIALLQSQVNPHFLYNTLDSVRWLAVLHKNPGIEKTVKSLSNLLKNIAKGVGNKISLEEEISLLEDYVDTQSVRFMELFDIHIQIPQNMLHYSIVKFTLQPLVENSLFHGIVPSGRCGKIDIKVEDDGEFILIYVEDDGVGIEHEKIELILKAKHATHSSGMAGIGIANVNERLKLIYGDECGLSIDSEINRFTQITVRIKKELYDEKGEEL